MLIPLLVALLVGLRHATDPDHLTAVSALILDQEHHGPRRAGILGLAWGLGHASTLFALGLPVLLLERNIPDFVQRIAEFAIGLVIIGLAARLLIRWRRGYFHLHPHAHGSLRHAHPHAHNRTEEHPIEHVHTHGEALGRSPTAAFGIGMVHGVGGSAAAGVLLLGAVSGKAQAILVLLTFAGATAFSMALLSSGFAYLLARGAVRRRLAQLVPILGTAGVLFGAWYSLGALQA